MTSVRLKDTTDVVRRPAWVGATEPTSDDTVTVGPGTLWIDDSTTPNVLKRRNDANNGWVAVGLVTGTTAVTAAPGNHNHTHDSLTGRTTDNHHAKAHNVGDAAAHPDVLVTSPVTGDAIVYDATAAKWKNVPVAGGVTLSSANPTTAAPSDAAAPGTGLSATRGDHRHGMPATWPPGSHAHGSHSGLGADDHTQYQLRSERAAASGYAPLDSGLLIPVANLGTGTPTGSKFLRDDRVWAVPSGGGGGSLTIEELDGTPSVAAATKLILPSGTVSVSGTEATYTPSGGGGGTDVASILTTPGDLLIESGSSYTRLSTPTASASSTNSGFVASNAFDGNTGTFWGSNVPASTPGEWLKGDFGSAVTPTAARLLQSAAGQRVGQWKLQSSPDNSTWTDQYTSATGQESVADSGILALTGMPAARYWRLISVSSTDGSIWLVYEFYLYSGGGPTPVRLAAWQTLTDAATVTWDVTAGHTAQVTLGGNRTLAAPTNLVAGQQYTLHVVQDGTGSRTLTWNAVFKWPSGTSPTLSTGAGKRDVFLFSTDGTNLYAVAQAIDVR